VTSCPRSRDHSREHQSPGKASDDYRPHFLVKINATSATAPSRSSDRGRSRENALATKWGADTVMDLFDRQKHSRDA